MKTLFELEQTRPPFESANVLAVNLPVMSYGKTPQQVQEFYHDVRRRVGALPGVEHVATGFAAPWRDDQGLNISFTFAAQGARRADRLPCFWKESPLLFCLDPKGLVLPIEVPELKVHQFLVPETAL